MNTVKNGSFGKWILLICLLFPVIVGAQTDTAANTYKKFNLSAGYGLASFFFSPNQQTTIYYQFDSTNNHMSSQTDLVVTDVKINPIFLRFDYKWDKKNSIGFMAMYNGYKASGTRTDSVWNAATSQFDVSQGKLSYSMQRIRLQVVYTRHFYVDRPRVNTYFYTSLGFNLKFNKTEAQTISSLPSDAGLTLTGSFPFSSRVCYGLRYNFSKSMSLLTEVGLGGPLLSIGLTAKF